MKLLALAALSIALTGAGCKAKGESTAAAAPASSTAVSAPETALRGTRPGETKRGNKGVLDVSFFVTADTHFGVGVPDDAPASRDPVKEPLGIEVSHAEIIRQMNSFEGHDFPGPLGGKLGKPRGVLIAGDLTEKGKDAQWASFRAYYGMNGKDGLLQMPAYEGVGNHDFWEIREKVKKDRGALAYSFDWDDLHVVCLGEAPDDKDLAWLNGDLELLEPDVPIVVFQHFPFTGPYSDTWFTRDGFDEKLGTILANRRIVGFFHGHFHATGTYEWHGIDVYNVGSAKHAYKSFSVVRITHDTMKVAEWNWEQRRWWWWHKKSMRTASEKETFGMAGAADAGPTPFRWR